MVSQLCPRATIVPAEQLLPLPWPVQWSKHLAIALSQSVHVFNLGGIQFGVFAAQDHGAKLQAKLHLFALPNFNMTKSRKGSLLCSWTAHASLGCRGSPRWHAWPRFAMPPVIMLHIGMSQPFHKVPQPELQWPQHNPGKDPIGHEPDATPGKVQATEHEGRPCGFQGSVPPHQQGQEDSAAEGCRGKRLESHHSVDIVALTALRLLAHILQANNVCNYPCVGGVVGEISLTRCQLQLMQLQLQPICRLLLTRRCCAVE